MRVWLGVAWLITGIARADGPEAIVDYRAEVMEAAHRHLKAIAAVAEGAPFRHHVAEHSRSLETFVRQLPELFPPGSRTGYSEAKPLIWEDAAGFAAAIEALRGAVAGLAAASERGADPGPAYDRVLDACKDCHRRYRAKY